MALHPAPITLTPGVRSALEEKVASLIDSETGTIGPEIYADPYLHELEQERVFGRCWLLVAHESLIPKAGDFFASRMGEDPVLVVRQKDGSIAVFLNQCRHRGARLCRADLGKTKAFQCTYHGWTYDLGGNLVSISKSDAVGGDRIDKSEWGAIKVAKIHNFYGLIFATWDEDAPSFEDSLGETRWYWEAMFNRPGGTEVIGGVQKWEVPANWKFGAEQFASDIYHFDYTHVASALAMMPEGMEYQEPPPLEGRQFRDRGHGGVATPMVEMSDMQTAMAMGMEVMRYNQSTRDAHAKLVGEQAAKQTQFVHANMFPNMGILPLNQTLRIWQPKGPNAMEVWAWTLVDRDAPEDIKKQCRIKTQMTFASSGVFEQDDAENWTEIQRVLRGTKARKTLFNNMIGANESKDPSGKYPGRTDRAQSEAASREFYSWWRDLMLQPVQGE
ncbi:aromatic ring-hydroxylating oxygenase subunit alpha [Aurantiacibacter sediminis]|uniref:Aromatic ring-hydroxylating dioxygenase subunit alpha n=1 Tax=Aurantiacibacter sediminis TaxID=2793064 RepID=A0ABS0N6S2_9SPHN|nr:aromatic ring-hydroxylating dioxygenase subunit alpha [Aurantiacibacter sediminis]MBH5323483.1 aromatic ring-hydroxylating dioxygenase subunit alpha [Aurantiacibacter sediminis]